jgi:hypothetical protein
MKCPECGGQLIKKAKFKNEMPVSRSGIPMRAKFGFIFDCPTCTYPDLPEKHLKFVFVAYLEKFPFGGNV